MGLRIIGFKLMFYNLIAKKMILFVCLFLCLIGDQYSVQNKLIIERR